MKKEELLEVYDLNSKLKGTQARKSFYKEIEKEYHTKGKITKKVKSIRVILLNSKGRIYLQKRSKFKEVNLKK